MQTTRPRFEVSVGDLIEASGVQVPLYRPAFFKFPQFVHGNPLGSAIRLSGSSARQWEFSVYQLPANNLSHKVINQIPILLSIVEVNTVHRDEQGKWVGLDRVFRALNPGLHICSNPECQFKQRFTTEEQRRFTYRGQIACRSGTNCKSPMVFAKVQQTVNVPEDVVKGLRHIYAEGAKPELTLHPPEVYMVLSTPSKTEWFATNKHLADIRAEYNGDSTYFDIVPWKQGVIAGEDPVGAMLVIPPESGRVGWCAEEELFGHSDKGYHEQFIYVRKEFSEGTK